MNKPTRCPQHNSRHQPGCGECRRYGREYRTYRRAHIAAGTWDAELVPVTPVREHARTCLNAGMSVTCVAEAAGIAYGTINRILYMRQLRTCTRANAEAILSVHPQSGNGRSVNGTGTARRIRALMVAGWTQTAIADRLGYDHSVISGWAILPVDGRVHPDSAADVRALYALMWTDEGLSHRTRQWALRRGWHPAEAWSDVTIDDPGAEAYGWCRNDVDDVALEQVEQGIRRWTTLTDAEQRELVRRNIGTYRPSTLASQWGTTRVRVEKLAAEVAGLAVAA